VADAVEEVPVGTGLLAGKVVLVSGLGPNLGRSMALAMAREGASVVLAARREKRLRRVADEIEAAGGRATCVPTDVTDDASCAALAEAVRAEHGRLDVLVNNAFSDGDHTLFVDADLAAWKATMDVNLWGTLAVTRALVDLLEASGDGRVVMVNTMSVHRVEPGFGAYVASKGALAAVTQSLAVELGRRGIRVNGIHPGYIFGDAVEWYLNHLAEERGVTYQEVYDEIADETCLGYLPPADEVAGAAVFFASPLARCITGQSLGVNAGHHLR
jgi:NAD(P)-dependent dehydrogenase (short-subunit alcohol dehydrogenase family)